MNILEIKWRVDCEQSSFLSKIRWANAKIAQSMSNEPWLAWARRVKIEARTVNIYFNSIVSTSDCTQHDISVHHTSFKAAICTANSSSILGNASAFLKDWLRFCSASSSFSCWHLNFSSVCKKKTLENSENLKNYNVLKSKRPDQVIRNHLNLVQSQPSLWLYALL